MDEERLAAELEAAFDGSQAERRVVLREARDLADSGKPERDRGRPLTVEEIRENLADAPDGLSLAERWNWWMGSLHVAYGGYDAFTVQAYEANG